MGGGGVASASPLLVGLAVSQNEVDSVIGNRSSKYSYLFIGVIYFQVCNEFYQDHGKFSRWPHEPRDTLEAVGASKAAKCIDGLRRGARRGQNTNTKRSETKAWDDNPR